MLAEFIGDAKNVYLLGADGPQFGGTLFASNSDNTGDDLKVKDIYRRECSTRIRHEHASVERVAHGTGGLELLESLKRVGREAGGELKASLEMQK
jgi:hypothetical protein